MIQALASVAGLGTKGTTTKGTTTKGTSPVHSTPYSTVKASADSKLPIQSSVAAAGVHEQVASLVLDNVKRLFLILAPANPKARSKVSSKRPLLNIIFRGARCLPEACQRFIQCHVLPTIPWNTVKSYLTNDLSTLQHDLFQKAQCTRIKEASKLNEALVIKKVLEGCDALEHRSGARTGTVFRVMSIEEMWGKYVDVYEQVKAEARSKNIKVPSKPHAKKHFWYAVMSHVRILKKGQACFRCVHTPCPAPLPLSLSCECNIPCTWLVCAGPWMSHLPADGSRQDKTGRAQVAASYSHRRCPASGTDSRDS